MPNLIDVSTWEEKPWYSTGGTRDKCLLESPDGGLYYFKTSLNKPNKDYKYEFWSEIIASELGKMLSLNILQYDVAIKDNKLGCLSKSMVDVGKERLTEGVNYLVGFDNNYDPNLKDHQVMYSYEFIKEALNRFSLKHFIPQIDEIIVFDALIGNGDRHQENWAIASEYTEMSKAFEEIVTIDETDNLITRGLKKAYNYILKERVSSSVLVAQSIWDKNVRFAPIYDSGSSLAREHDDDKLQIIIKDKIQFEAYINRGKSEIHWRGLKLNHFELVSQLAKQSLKARETIQLFNERFNEEAIFSILRNLDVFLPDKFNNLKLSECRKEFLLKLIVLRHKKLQGI
ncbi:MAG TPA: hypothetical protein DIT07_08885 [Sphingobacteriaceae bacterium]|nr:hypothetical protein [Sphingobacteriaceae bacterium]